MFYVQNCIKKLYPEVNSEKFFLQEGKTSDYSFDQAYSLSKIVNKPVEDVLNEMYVELQTIPHISVEMQSPRILVNYTSEYLTEQINSLFNDVCNNNGKISPPIKTKEKVLIDFSSPNFCKEMHVGHLRSTIIGESLCRLFEYLGDEVLRVNHIGDWGTQFGMLIAYIKKYNVTEYNITTLTKMYKEAKKIFDSDPEFKSQSREETFALQRGAEENVLIWKHLCQISLEEFNKIYNILGTHSTVKGESFYQQYMVDLLQQLQPHLVEDDGAKIIYANDNRLTLVKSDGAFTYDTSDLAALHYRLFVENVNKIVYIVDLGQKLHFETLFSVANNLGFIGEKKLEYVGFGVVLGTDGKKLKTRSGETIKLSGLLEEAYSSALKLTSELTKNKYNEQTTANIARKISINCIKYADLSNPRISNYKYSSEKMLNTKGNTAVYLMYAMARCKSILRKVDFETLNNQEIVINSKECRNLVFQILKYYEILDKTAKTLSPHHLCNYLYCLVTSLTKFYETNRCIDFFPNGDIKSVNEPSVCLIYLSIIVVNQLFYLIGLEQIDQI